MIQKSEDSIASQLSLECYRALMTALHYLSLSNLPYCGSSWVFGFLPPIILCWLFLYIVLIVLIRMPFCLSPKGFYIMYILCYSECVQAIYSTHYTPAWRVIRGDLDVDSYLENAPPPTCCSESSFDSLIWDIWSELQSNWEDPGSEETLKLYASNCVALLFSEWVPSDLSYT